MKQFKILLPTFEYAVFSIALYHILNMIFNSFVGFSISVFAGFPKLICYPCSHPIPFILINCFTFFLTQVILSRSLRKNRFRVLRYVYFYLFWTVATCILGGLLGSYYDMEAGHYPTGEKLRNKLIDDMFFRGFSHGLSIIIFSIPYNIIILIGSFCILKYNNILGNAKK